MDTAKKFKYWQTRTLVGTIIGYAIFYIVRKNFSMAAPGMLSEFGVTRAELGIFLTLHSLIYGVSKFLSGFAADKLSSRHMLVCSLLLCSICNVLIGFNSSITIIGIFWIFNGLFQGASFPPVARLLTYWIPPNQLASKMSKWQTSHSIGSAAAAIICGKLAMTLGWRWCFYVPSLIALLGIAFMWITLRDTPKSVGLPELDETERAKKLKQANAVEVKPEIEYKKLLMEKVFKNKVVWVLALANFPVYALRFAILDWGPMLLKEWKGISLLNAGLITAAFEIAGIAGILVTGRATDKFFNGKAHRVCILCMLLASVGLLLFWKVTSAPVWLYITFLIFSGFFIYGAHSLGTIATANAATRRVAATACGFHGFWGYLSVVVTGWGIGRMTDKFGWAYSLGVIVYIAFVGVLLFCLIWNAKEADGYRDL
ncbi:MAG: MFS transporter [Endomicrobium sp.]|jgi:OPA family glycerol-3-phosphate transporter-like MFS transporter/OPA family sugar phosphate sensor protein UhpC-like MFS transporter|nr:MFS transporter [Endomicrobium sp.]